MSEFARGFLVAVLLMSIIALIIAWVRHKRRYQLWNDFGALQAIYEESQEAIRRGDWKTFNELTKRHVEESKRVKRKHNLK